MIGTRTVLLLCVLPPLQLLSAQSSSSCSPSGVWGAWGNWTACPSPPSPIPMVNVQRRIRPCNPQPTGCVASAPYNCSGAYSEVQSCPSNGTAGPSQLATNVGGGTWSASMVQSMQVSDNGPRPAGSSLSAGMAQAMQINDTGAGMAINGGK